MKNLKIALILSLSVIATTAHAGADFISDFRTGTSSSHTTGTVKITGTDNSIKKIDISGITGKYDIDVATCSNCSGNTSDDYTTIGNIVKVDRVITHVDRTQNLDVVNNETFCETEVDLGGLRSTYGSASYASTEKVEVKVNDLTYSDGTEYYSADVMKGGHKVGTITNNQDYNKKSLSDLTTVQTKRVTGHRISSYIGG